MDTAILDTMETDLAELADALDQFDEFGAAAEREPIIEAGLNVKNSNDAVL